MTTQAEVQDKYLSQLVTRGDFKDGLKKFETRLLKWGTAMFIAQTALIVGAVFTLLRAFSGH
ncbi:MAG: hypothetical protein G8345_16125 [Magnetococcales bacterium]|nr:hypothetical protein [Magnetococcales bacterium]NGZ28402.1 hypothetical protein [Magnetococcales bacterium]